MSEPPEIGDLVRAWVEKAEHDLLNIQNNLAAETVPWDTLSKALLTFHRIDFPKIHDLTELYALLPKDLRPAIEPRLLEQLNPYSIEGRYPGIWESIEEAEARCAVEAARAVRQAVRTRLPSESLR